VCPPRDGTWPCLIRFELLEPRPFLRWRSTHVRTYTLQYYDNGDPRGVVSGARSESCMYTYRPQSSAVAVRSGEGEESHAPLLPMEPSALKR
jgi:hypothetical protein